MSSETNDNLTTTILIVILVIIGISLLVSFVVLVHHFTSAAGGPYPSGGGGNDPSGGGGNDPSDPSDPSGGGSPTDPSGGGSPTDPSGGGSPTDPSGGGSPTDPSGGGSPTGVNGQTCVTNSNCVSNNCIDNTYTYNYLNSGTNYTYNISLPTGAQFIESRVAGNDTQWFIVYLYQINSLYYYGITGPTFSGEYPISTSDVLLGISQVLIANNSLFIFLDTDGSSGISIENTYIRGGEDSDITSYDPLKSFIPSLIDNGTYLITSDGITFTIASATGTTNFILDYDPEMDITTLVYCPTSTGNYLVSLSLDKSSVLVWNIDQDTSSVKTVLSNSVLSLAFYVTSNVLSAFVLTDEPKLGTVTIGELDTLTSGSVDIQEIDMDVDSNAVVSYGNGDSIFLPGMVCN